MDLVYHDHGGEATVQLEPEHEEHKCLQKNIRLRLLSTKIAFCPHFGAIFSYSIENQFSILFDNIPKSNLIGKEYFRSLKYNLTKLC